MPFAMLISNSLNRKEKIRLDGVKKLTFILKVLDTCVTYEQIENTRKWGFKILFEHFKICYTQSTVIFLEAVNKKLNEIKNT